MIRIAKCESNFNPNAVGDGLLPSTIAYKAMGLPYGESVSVFQIRLLPGRPSKSYLMQVDNNINYAKKLYEASGYGPWSCARILGIK
jgi:hypothetical protein